MSVGVICPPFSLYNSINKALPTLGNRFIKNKSAPGARSGPAIPFSGVIQLKQFGNCTVCHSLAANPFVSWLRTHASEQKQQPGRSRSRGQAPGLPASLLGWHWDFLACVLLFFTCKVGMGDVCMGVWEAL